MLIGVKLDKPVPTNDPSVAEERLCISGQKNNRRLQLKNAKFFAAPAAERRVIIAKDVLVWLDMKRLVPHAGRYVEYRGGEPDAEPTPKEPDRVDGSTCHACALGAVFACTVERAGGVSNFWNFAGRRGNRELHDFLKPHFDVKQLKLIECAFECHARHAGHTPEAYAAETFGRQADNRDCHDSDDDRRLGDLKRMRAIMENIIRNKGTFVP